MTPDNWQAAMEDNPDILWTIIADIVKVAQSAGSPGRVGRRPGAESVSIDELWKILYPEKFTMESFRMALQDLMASAGLSQRQFANLIPCSQGQLHKWLDGSRKLNLVALERIAMALNVPPSYFVEYRAMKFADLISSHFLKNPNASITVAKALAKK